MNDQTPAAAQTDLLYGRYQALLEISEAIASHRELDRLFRDLAPRLHRVVEFDFANLILYEPSQKSMRSHVLETPETAYACPPGDCPMETVGGWVRESQNSWIVSDVAQDNHFPNVADWLQDRGVFSVCVVPVTTALRRVGALAFGSRMAAAYSEIDVIFLQQVARQVAVAVDNALNFEQAQSGQQQLEKERDRLGLLLDVTNTIVSSLDLHELLNAVSSSLKRLVPHEYASLSLYDPETQRLQIHALDFPVSKGLLKEGLWVPVEGSPTGRAIMSGKPILITRADIAQFGSDIARRILDEGLKSAYCLPLISHGRPLGTLVVASLREENFPERDAELLRHIANQIAIAVENALAFRRMADRAQTLREEKLYLQDEIRTEYNFEEIIGDSVTLRRILEELQTVAPTDSTILILGETGTGKELIARAIHHLSARRERTLVKVNCAAIPTGLLESELFGHEKGAFTGALERRSGCFELSQHGTLLLDELAEMPVNTQAKLLRVLEDSRVRRLGGKSEISIDVRVIAATNRDLEAAYRRGDFRKDLYFRLNVVTVQLPPLRERRSDIPLLVQWFLERLSKGSPAQVTASAMKCLLQYDWPGNVRELENCMERATALGDGRMIDVDDLPGSISNGTTISDEARTSHPTLASSTDLEDIERATIQRVFDQVNGDKVIARKMLGISRATLYRKLKRYNIGSRADFSPASHQLQ